MKYSTISAIKIPSHRPRPLLVADAYKTPRTTSPYPADSRRPRALISQGIHRHGVDAPSDGVRYLRSSALLTDSWAKWRALSAETSRTFAAFIFNDALCGWEAVEPISITISRGYYNGYRHCVSRRTDLPCGPLRYSAPSESQSTIRVQTG